MSIYLCSMSIIKPKFLYLLILVFQVNCQIKTYCGEMQAKTEFGDIEFIITENRIISSFLFSQIYQNQGASVITNNSETLCSIRVCGFSTGPYVEVRGECQEFDKPEWNPVKPPNGQTGFQLSSISCGCDKNRPDCHSDTCGTKNPPSVECAILYQERNCTECLYDGILLDDNGVYDTQNSAAIKSMYVVPGCVVTKTNYGRLWDDFFTIEKEHFNHSTPIVPISYYKKGEDFYCKCYPLPSTTESSQPSLDNRSKAIIGGVVGGSVTLLVLMGALICVVFRIINKSRILLTDDEVRECLEGVHEADDTTQPGEYTCSNSKAMRLPYDSKWEVQRKQLIFDCKDSKSKLGSGEFGQVYRGKFYSDGKLRHVAIKTLNSSAKLGDLKSLVNEIKVISYVGSHPNIVGFIGACTVNLKKGEVFSVIELCPIGSLKEYLISLKNINPEYINLSQTNDEGYYTISASLERVSSGNMAGTTVDKRFINQLRWARGTAAGMEYLCERNVLHIDLAARNILLSEDLNVKISDFGLSKKLYSKSEYDKMGKDLLPIKWIALECMTDKKFSVKSDVWAYAVTLWEIFELGNDPYPMQGVSEILNFLQCGGRLSCPLFATEDIYTKMLECWNTHPDSRPSFCELRIFFETVIGSHTEYFQSVSLEEADPIPPQM